MNDVSVKALRKEMELEEKNARKLREEAATIRREKAILISN